MRPAFLPCSGTRDGAGALTMKCIDFAMKTGAFRGMDGRFARTFSACFFGMEHAVFVELFDVGTQFALVPPSQLLVIF